MSDELNGNSTLDEAKEWLRPRLPDGARCPCCTQFAKVYERHINSGMARALIAIYHAGEKADDTDGFVHGPTVSKCHETAQLSWWGLIQEEMLIRPDGGRAGWWRITSRGRQWLRGGSVPEYVSIYDSRVLKEPHGDPWTAQQALGKKFDLNELMGRSDD